MSNTFLNELVRDGHVILHYGPTGRAFGNRGNAQYQYSVKTRIHHYRMLSLSNQSRIVYYDSRGNSKSCLCGMSLTGTSDHGSRSASGTGPFIYPNTCRTCYTQMKMRQRSCTLRDQVYARHTSRNVIVRPPLG